MKFYETADAQFYVDIPNSWEWCCQYGANKSWEYKPRNKSGCINCYRDYEGAWLPPQITRQHYYLKDEKWHSNRIKPWACLPVFYASGYRFIRLSQAPPVNFKCAEFPFSLREAQEKAEQLRMEAEALARKARLARILEAECKKKGKNKRKAVEPPKKKKN